MGSRLPGPSWSRRPSGRDDTAVGQSLPRRHRAAGMARRLGGTGFHLRLPCSGTGAGGVVPGATGGSAVLNGGRRRTPAVRAGGRRFFPAFSVAATRRRSAPARGPSARRPCRESAVSGCSPGSGRRTVRLSERRSERKRPRWGRARPGPASVVPSRRAAAVAGRRDRRGVPGLVPALPSGPEPESEECPLFAPQRRAGARRAGARRGAGRGRRGRVAARRREGGTGRRQRGGAPGRGTIPGAGRPGRAGAGRSAGSGGGRSAAAKGRRQRAATAGGRQGGHTSSDLLRVGCKAGGNLW